MNSIELVEHQTTTLPRRALNDDDAAVLRRRYGDFVQVRYPSPATSGQWGITVGGRIGVVPLSSGRVLHVRPKGPIGHLFHMLQETGRMPTLYEGEVQVSSVEDYVDRLAGILARRVWERSRRGLHRQYVETRQDVRFIRGRIDVARHLRESHLTRVPCRFEEHTADIEDNRILAWTLHQVARLPHLRTETLRHVRRARHALNREITLRPYTAQDCRKPTYDRLNEDYRPMHALCAFLLAGVSPSNGRLRENGMLPFLVDMPSLFEAYAVARLRSTVPSHVSVDDETTLPFDLTKFEPDIVLRDEAGTAVAVIDVKYKYAATPASEDVQQVVAYAAALQCDRAMLLYPDVALAGHSDVIGDVRVETCALDLTAPPGGRAPLEVSLPSA